MKQSPKQPAEKRRAQLIKAATKIFTRKGYSGATTEEIARATRLTKGALYFHFKNKEEIFFAVIKEINSTTQYEILRHLTENVEPAEMIEKLIHSGFELIRKQIYFSVDFWQQVHKRPKIRKYIAEEHRRLQDKVVRYLSRKTSLKKKECESYFIMLHAIFHGVMVENICCSTNNELDRLIPQMVEMSKLYFRKNELKSG